jgi:hypothetical protein
MLINETDMLSLLVSFGKSDTNLYGIATIVWQNQNLSSYKTTTSRNLKGNKRIDRRLNEIYLDSTGRGYLREEEWALPEGLLNIY